MSRHEHIWRCSCGGAQFVSLRWHDEWLSDVDFSGTFQLEGDFRTAWRSRLIQAWRIIRNGHEDSWVEIVLTPETARSITGALAEYLQAAENADDPD